MNQLKKLSTLGLTLSLGLTACQDDGTGPDADGPFDPAASAADLQTVQSAFDTPVFASLGQMSGQFNRINGAPAVASNLLGASWKLATAGSEWEQQQAGSDLAGALYSSSAAVILIPDDYRGRTYTYDPQEGYFYNEDRTGAPADGIRFILYQLDPASQEPGSAEIGYVDITDESTDLSGVARLSVVSGGVEYMNYSVSATVLVGSVAFVVDGFISNGTDQVDLDLSTAFSNTFGSSEASIDYVIAIPSREFSMSASLVMSFQNELEQGSVTVDVQFQERTNSVRIQGSFATGSSEGSDSGSLEVLVNGALFATIGVEGETYTITGPDGAALSAEHAQALDNMMDSFERVFDDSFEDFVRPVSWLFNMD